MIQVFDGDGVDHEEMDRWIADAKRKRRESAVLALRQFFSATDVNPYGNGPIATIRRCREIMNLGLRDAKDFCEKHVFEKGPNDAGYVVRSGETW